MGFSRLPASFEGLPDSVREQIWLEASDWIPCSPAGNSIDFSMQPRFVAGNDGRDVPGRPIYGDHIEYDFKLTAQIMGADTWFSCADAYRIYLKRNPDTLRYGRRGQVIRFNAERDTVFMRPYSLFCLWMFAEPQEIAPPGYDLRRGGAGPSASRRAVLLQGFEKIRRIAPNIPSNIRALKRTQRLLKNIFTYKRSIWTVGVWNFPELTWSMLRHRYAGKQVRTGSMWLGAMKEELLEELLKLWGDRELGTRNNTAILEAIRHLDEQIRSFFVFSADEPRPTRQDFQPYGQPREPASDQSDSESDRSDFSGYDAFDDDKNWNDPVDTEFEQIGMDNDANILERDPGPLATNIDGGNDENKPLVLHLPEPAKCKPHGAQRQDHDLGDRITIPYSFFDVIEPRKRDFARRLRMLHRHRRAVAREQNGGRLPRNMMPRDPNEV